jgi:hypothetical protein
LLCWPVVFPISPNQYFLLSFNANARYNLYGVILWFYCRIAYSTLIQNDNYLYK